MKLVTLPAIDKEVMILAASTEIYRITTELIETYEVNYLMVIGMLEEVKSTYLREEE